MNRISETGVNNIRVVLQSETLNSDAILSLITRLMDADHDLWKATWNVDPRVGAYERFAEYANRRRSVTLRGVASQLLRAVTGLLSIHHRLLLSEMILYSWRTQLGSFGDKHRSVPTLDLTLIPSDLLNLSKQETVKILCRELLETPCPMEDFERLVDPNHPSAHHRYLMVIHNCVGILRWISSVLRDVYFEERLKQIQIEEFVHRTFTLPAHRIMQRQAQSREEVVSHD